MSTGGNFGDTQNTLMAHENILDVPAQVQNLWHYKLGITDDRWDGDTWDKVLMYKAFNTNDNNVNSYHT